MKIAESFAFPTNDTHPPLAGLVVPVVVSVPTLTFEPLVRLHP